MHHLARNVFWVSVEVLNVALKGFYQNSQIARLPIADICRDTDIQVLPNLQRGAAARTGGLLDEAEILASALQRVHSGAVG